MKRSVCRLVIIVALGIGSVIGDANAVVGTPIIGTPTVYDAVNDFNATGVQTVGATWTYGSEASLSGTGFSLLSNFSTLICNSSDNTCNPTGATQLAYGIAPYHDPNPSVIDNASGSAITYTSGSQANGVGVNNLILFPNNVLALPPNGQMVLVRFTVPADGLYNIAGYFLDLQAASVGLDIVINGTVAFQNLTSFTGTTALQGSVPFSFTDMQLAANDTVDFIVDGTMSGTNDDIVVLLPRSQGYRSCLLVPRAKATVKVKAWRALLCNMEESMPQRRP
jgi:hypothetical protein